MGKSSDGMRLTDENGTIVMCNNAYAEMVENLKLNLKVHHYQQCIPPIRPTMSSVNI
jgi:hypothetical protein